AADRKKEFAMTEWMTKIRRECRRVVSRLRPKPRSSAGRLAEWRRVHQPFELRFHQGQNYRWSNQTFWAQWDEIFGRFLDLRPGHFSQDAVLLDVGCGSRPVLDWFTSDCEKHFLDPLLSEYLQIDAMRPHWRDKPAERLLSQPAEVRAEQLVGKCDFVN